MTDRLAANKCSTFS